MADRDKVIKGLNCCTKDVLCDSCPYTCKNNIWPVPLMLDVLELLGEAVKPKRYEETRYNGELVACGDCMHELEMKPRYCPYCGKKVQWDA